MCIRDRFCRVKCGATSVDDDGNPASVFVIEEVSNMTSLAVPITKARH